MERRLSVAEEKGSENGADKKGEAQRLEGLCPDVIPDAGQSVVCPALDVVHGLARGIFGKAISPFRDTLGITHRLAGAVVGDIAGVGSQSLQIRLQGIHVRAQGVQTRVQRFGFATYRHSRAPSKTVRVQQERLSASG